MPQCCRIADFEYAVFSDGILLFVLEGGSTALLPITYRTILDFLAKLPKVKSMPLAVAIAEEISMDGVGVEEICQTLIDAGVVAVC